MEDTAGVTCENTKERTILSQCQDGLSELKVLQNILLESFSREAKANKPTNPPTPQRPNVLDEILDLLEDMRNTTGEIRGFVAEAVIQKIY